MSFDSSTETEDETAEVDVPDVESPDVDVPDVTPTDDAGPEPAYEPGAHALVTDEAENEPSDVESLSDDATIDDDLSAMPPPAVAPTSESPAATSLLSPGVDTPRKRADDLVLDPRALKALSRQERKDAKSAIRREQKEAREAARRAKAESKAEAKADTPAETPAEAPDGPSDDALTEALTALEPDVSEPEVEPAAEMPPPVITPPVITPPAVTPSVTSSDPGPPPSPSSATDPRARAAARVQRRLGRDAEKVSAAESRAQAREEARRRRAQAKELRSGTAAAEAAEAVVRMPEDQLDATAEIPAVDEPETQLIPPVAETPVVDHEHVRSDPIAVAAEALAADVHDDVSDDTDDLTDDDIAEAVDDSQVDDVHVDPEGEEAEFTAPASDDPLFDESGFDELGLDESVSTSPVPDAMPAPVVGEPAAEKAVPKRRREPAEESDKKSGLGPIAGIVGLVALSISVLLAVSALTVALGVDSGGVYSALKALANALVGPLKDAFDQAGSNADRKEHFLAWGAGSLVYLMVSFVAQAVQRKNSDDA